MSELPEEIWLFKYKHHGMYDGFSVFQSEPGDKTNASKFIRADLCNDKKQDKCVDCGSEMIEVCSGLEKECRNIPCETVEVLKGVRGALSRALNWDIKADEPRPVERHDILASYIKDAIAALDALIEGK